MKTIKTFFLTLCGLIVLVACQKEMSIETGSTFGGLAVGTLKDTATGNCLPITVKGTYKADSTLGDSNYVNIQVNITTPGNYKIISDSVNGFYFKDSGFISTPGLKTIKLKGIGKPVSGTQTTFTIGFGSGFCSFSVNVTGTGTGGGGTGGGGTGINASDTAWSFSEGTKFYDGYFEDIFTETIPGFGTVLSFEGYTNVTNDDTAMYIDVLLPGTTIQTGTYSTATNSAFNFFKDSLNIYYEADPTIPAVSTQIVISSYDPVTKIILGTFSGTAKTGTGVTVNIMNGRFRGKVN